MKKVAVVLFVLLLAMCSFAADGKQVTYKSGSETVSGMLYTPAGKGPFPALVVIHEWYGLNAWVKEQASKLADQGYETLAIDLYRGKVAANGDEAHELMRGVPEDRAKRDLASAFGYLAVQKRVDPKRIGGIGWCMGGGYALNLAINEPRLKAVVINYGHLASDDATLKKINARVLGIFGGKDRGIPSDSVKQFEKQLKAQGKTVEIHIYDDAGHGFQNPTNKEGYNAADAKDAWERITAFLKKNL